ncbi:MAG: tRNA pseudouridine synthase A, partial [Actinobacteria bacterium]|nr:tRNA pseudouridine synthase A [Actinomycetota bacterium]
MEPTLNPESGFLRFRADFSYDGTNFNGWARQPELRTVQGELEKALAGLTRFDIELVVAGEWKVEDLLYRLNRMLDEDIRINSLSKAPPFFHARFSALRRKYIYKIADGRRQVEPLKRFDIAPWYRDLDMNPMNEASKLLLGEHDFAAFCKTGGIGTTIRRLEKFEWKREGDLLVAEVVADAFCYSMVRNLVGACVRVGEGRFEPNWIKDVLEN